MYNFLKKYKITLVFYITVIFLFITLVFAKLAKEPYPSFNMPAFKGSGINNEILSASYFEIVYLNNEEEVWRGDLKEFFNPENLIKYGSNMKFIFFNQAKTYLNESKKPKGRIISSIPGGVKIRETIKKWITNDVIGGADIEIPKLMFKKKPFESNEVTGFIVNEYKEYYHLVEGFQYREIVRYKEYKFEDDTIN